MSQKKIFATLGAVAVAVTGGIVAFANSYPDSEAKAKGAAAAVAVDKNSKAELGVLKGASGAAGGLEAAPASLPAARVEAVEENVTLRLTGSLAADEESDVGINISGTVQEVLVERGTLVEKGDVLVQLDPTDMKNQLALGEASVEELRVRLGLEKGEAAFDPEEQPEVKTAKAALDLATLTDTRYANMVSQGIASKEVYDQAHAEWQSAKQRYEQAVFTTRQLYQTYLTAQTRLAPLRKAVEDTTVRAPFSGWVKERLVSAGEHIAPGKDGVVAIIVKTDPLRLMLTVPQQNASAVTPGQKVTFKVDGVKEKTFEGVVRYVGPSVETNSRSLMAEAVVQNPDRLLRPGLFATADLVMPETQTKLLVPEQAVIRQGDVATVYVVQDGLARQRVASLGSAVGERVEVLRGLEDGDVVLTDPGEVRDGDPVDARLN